MKRSSAISFKLSSKRKCDLHLNSLKSKSGLPCFPTEVDDSKYSNEPPFVTHRSIAIEDTLTVCKRLKSEGNILAENSRFWEALSKFKGAIELQLEQVSSRLESIDTMDKTPSVLLSVLHELCSQCYSELGELYPAVESAEKAVNYNRSCYVALQTLARAQVNIGELYLAKDNIQHCLHLDPSCFDSWADLKHIVSLTQKLKSTSWSNLPVETRPGVVCQR